MHYRIQFNEAQVHQHGGKLVKCIGDATLSVFPEAKVDAGVQAMHILKQRSDQAFAGRGHDCPLRIALHFGPVTCGRFGPDHDKRFDVLGATVNTAVTLKTHDITLTPEVFKKHTPPIRYIPLNSPHHD